MRYDAFISYRHSDLDMYMAKKIHKGLETYKVPRSVAKKLGKKKIARVFRDQEELPIGSDLSNNIESALRESEYLLVICSPRTPDSYWVQTEISTFIQMHGRDHVLAVLIEGEPSDSFPAQLLIDEEGRPVEPLAADVRGTSKKEMNRKLSTEIIRLAASVLGCNYDDLRQRHRERRLKKMMALATVVAGLAVAFGLYSAHNTAMIRKNFEEKQVSQSKYLAKTALSLLEEGNREDAVLVALEALPSEEDARPYVPEAQNALSEALGAYLTGYEITMDRVLPMDIPARDLVYNEAGDKLLSMDTSCYIYVWNVEDGTLLTKLPPFVSADTGYLETPKNQFLLSNDTVVIVLDNAIVCYDLEGNILWQKDSERYYAYAKYNVNTDKIYAWNADFIEVWDGCEGKLLTTYTRVEGEAADSGYSSDCAISEDDSIFAISRWNSEDDATVGYISIFKNGEETIVEIPFSYVADLCTCPDGGMAAVGEMYTSLYETTNDTTTMRVVKLDKEDGHVLWTQEFETVSTLQQSGNIQIRARDFEEDGIKYSDVIACLGTDVYDMESATGEVVAKTSVTQGIMRMLVSGGSNFGFLGQADGNVDIVNLRTGSIYSNNRIETGKPLRDMVLKNGVLAFRAQYDSNITMMKYLQGDNCTELLSANDTIMNVYFSKDEKYYALDVFCGSETENRALYEVYRAEDDTKVAEYAIADNYVCFEDFVEENTFCVIESDGTIHFYDVENQSEDTAFVEEKYGLKAVPTNDGRHIILHSSREFWIVDVEKHSVSETYELDSYIFAMIADDDLDNIFVYARDEGIVRVSMSDGIVENLDAEYRILNSTHTQAALAIDSKQGLLAVACSDNQLRVYDYVNKATIMEFPYATYSRRAIRFCNEGTQLMLQGDDYYIKVYDMNQKKFVYVSQQAYPEIEAIYENEEKKIWSIVTLGGIIVLDHDSYERLAEIGDGMAYLPTVGKVYVAKYSTLYSFPYKNLDMLMQEAHEKFPNATLSEQKRAMYNVD